MRCAKRGEYPNIGILQERQTVSYNTTCSDVQEMLPVPQVPPDGHYHGKWCGASVKFAVGNRIFVATTQILVKGNVGCLVCVRDGAVTVLAKKS